MKTSFRSSPGEYSAALLWFCPTRRLSSVRDPKKKKYIYRSQDRPEGISFFVTRLSVFSRGGTQVPLEEWTWFCASALGGERCATELTGT